MSSREEIVVPSGRTVTFHEMIWDQPGSGLIYRFRFIFQDLATEVDTMDYEEMERDLAHLCNEYALPRVADTGPQPGQIVISLSDRETEFGEPAPEATQIFEAYSLTDNTCVWEPF